jgi:hypothetical protein
MAVSYRTFCLATGEIPIYTSFAYPMVAFGVDFEA